MFETISYNGTKEENYQLLIKQLASLLEDEKDVTANLCQCKCLTESIFK